MAIIEPFEKYYKEYDDWFIRNKDIYQAELGAIKTFIPKNKKGIEIGVGTGRFAINLGIKIGLEPSEKMAEISRKKGIKVYKGVAEKLPFKNETFDFVLFVTTICFVDDLVESFKESYRVLKTDGFIIIGFIDKESELGLKYQLKKEKSNFYKDANFYSVNNVLNFLRKTNFKNITIKQTVFPSQIDKLDCVKDGYGEGSFIIMKANKN